MGAYDLWKEGGRTFGILGMTIPHLKRRHVAAVDQAGVVDPADGYLDHIHLADYIQSRLPQGVVFDTDFLAILRRSEDRLDPSSLSQTIFHHDVLIRGGIERPILLTLAKPFSS